MKNNKLGILNEAKWNFHFGSNHNGQPYKSENRYMCYHETGQFGSGTYFSTYSGPYENRGDLEQYRKGGNPEFIQIASNLYRVDMDLYKNLYRVYAEKQGDVLHTMLGDLNGFFNCVSGHGLGEYYPKQADFDLSYLFQRISLNAKALKLKCPNYMGLIRMAQEHAKRGKDAPQSFSTVFMEYNGFNGVNVSGIDKFDNSKHGSVIYDLSKYGEHIEAIETPIPNVGTSIGRSHTNTVAYSIFNDSDKAIAQSLEGKMPYNFKKLGEAEQFRIIKNIIQHSSQPYTSFLSADDIKYYLGDKPKILKYLFRSIFNGKVPQEHIENYGMTRLIVELNLTYFINYTFRNDYTSFLVNFLDYYKYNVVDEDDKNANEKLQAYLDELTSKLTRPLTEFEKSYIKEDYFDNPFMTENKKCKKIYISESKLYLLKEENKEVLYFDCFEATKQFLKDLLVKSFNEVKVPDLYSKHGINKDELIKKLKDQGLLKSKEEITEVPIKDGESKKRAKHTITFSIPRKNFKEKMHLLYKDVFTNELKEDTFKIPSVLKNEKEEIQKILSMDDSYKTRGGYKLSEMTLKQAIKHCEEKAEELKGKNCDCSKDHAQLEKWLKELQQLRKQKNKNHKIQENIITEDYNENHPYYEYLSDYDEYYVFNEFKYNPKKNTIWFPLINPDEYQKALDEFTQYGEFIKFPTKKIYQWMGIIMKNTAILKAMTAIGGHAMWWPTDEFIDVFFEGDREEFEEYAESIGEDADLGAGWQYLEKMGYDEWSLLPDGSDAVSDYGIDPLEKIISEYNSNMTPEQVIVIINKALDVVHCRGDLSSMFIKGGTTVLNRISNPQYYGA